MHGLLYNCFINESNCLSHEKWSKFSKKLSFFGQVTLYPYAGSKLYIIVYGIDDVVAADLVDSMKQQRQPSGATESIGRVLVEWVQNILLAVTLFKLLLGIMRSMNFRVTTQLENLVKLEFNVGQGSIGEIVVCLRCAAAVVMVSEYEISNLNTVK